MSKGYTMGGDRRLLNVEAMFFYGETIMRSFLLFVNVRILCEWLGQRISI